MPQNKNILEIKKVIPHVGGWLKVKLSKPTIDKLWTYAKKAKEDLTIEQDKTKNLELSLKTTKLQHKDEIESYDSKLKEINKEKKLIEEKLLISTNTENLEEK